MKRLLPNLMVFGVFLFGVKHGRIGLVFLILVLAVHAYGIFHLGISVRAFLEAII